MSNNAAFALTFMIASYPAGDVAQRLPDDHAGGVHRATGGEPARIGSAHATATTRSTATRATTSCGVTPDDTLDGATVADTIDGDHTLRGCRDNNDDAGP
jgi:hypothetical protein